MIIGQRGGERKQLSETARWFDRCPGPIKVEVDYNQVELKLNEDGVLSWDAAFETLNSIRAEKELAPSHFLALGTHSPNENNWFAAQDPENNRNGFGHVEDFSWFTSAPASVISAHYILKGIFNALVSEAGLDWLELMHDEPRGCFYDFCEVKTDLNFKLRTADICGDCLEIFREIGIPDELLRQTVEIMEACRPYALSTQPYRREEESFGSWPFPVAITKHKVVQASDPLLKFLLLLDHFDSLIRYFYLAREILEGRAPELEERPSLGRWVDRLAQSLKGHEHFREVVAIAQRENVVNLRNERRGHGYMASDTQAYKAETKLLENVIGEIEEELIPFFESHRLLILRQTEVRSGKYVARGEELRGSHLLHPPFEVDLENDPVSSGITDVNEVYVTDSNRRTFHRLSPFVRSAVCPSCRQPRILITDGGNRYIDVFIGHRVDLE